MHPMIDLRSDTVTRPTPAMRRAMAEAEVGDDVFGDDPTVHRLEERVADLLGKEAAVFVPSGTMGNQIALRTLTQPGDEVLVEGQAHIYYYEAGGPAALSGVMCRCLTGRRGVFSGADVESVLRPADVHFAPTRLVCVENTHNRGGGKVWSLTEIEDVAHAARRHGLALHLDGARLWNASVAQGVPERDYAAPFDTVNVCFSKGLGAPVGSALAGTRDLIRRARRFRKQFGGGRRQAGILAAGALHALEHHRARLAEDHTHARRLAEALADLPDVTVDPTGVETNLVRIGVVAGRAPALAARLHERGVWMLPTGPDTLRAVTNLDVSAADLETAIAVCRAVLGAAAKA
jgi:threonine aldolase